MRVFAGEGFIPEGVNDGALFVQHVIEFESALPIGVVPLFHTLLGTFDGAVQPRVFEFLTIFQAHFFHEFGHALGGSEIQHELVLEAEEEDGFTRVTLTGATATQLTVDAAGFVTLRGNHEQAAEFSDARA